MKTKFLKQLILFVSKSSILVGGQAVIEGVMMRVPGAYSTAVRDPKGEIHIDRYDFESITDRKPRLKKPVIRGAVSLFEAMKMGFKTLQWSADIAMPEESENVNPIVDAVMTLFSIALAICLFFAAPIGFTSWLFDKDQDPFIFNIISGALRIFFFLIYLILISLMSDVKRLFQYHGAEHKVVFNFESGKKINVVNAQKFSTYHPRCGTSFMFILMIVTIFTYSVIDSVFVNIFNTVNFNIVLRIGLHLACLPIVAGLGYEVLKFLSKHQDKLLFYVLSLPGLWLQRITTKNPTDSQIEVSIAALNAAFDNDLSKFEGQQHVADALG